MSVAGLGAYVQKSASHHPLMTGGFAIFLGVTLLLGLMHESLIAGEVSIVFVRRFKREAGELAEMGKRLKKELTTWEESKDRQPLIKSATNPNEERADGQ